MNRHPDDPATFEDHRVAMWCCGHCVNLFLDHARTLRTHECLLKAFIAWRLANEAIVFRNCLRTCTFQATCSLQTVAGRHLMFHCDECWRYICRAERERAELCRRQRFLWRARTDCEILLQKSLTGWRLSVSTRLLRRPMPPPEQDFIYTFQVITQRPLK